MSDEVGTFVAGVRGRHSASAHAWPSRSVLAVVGGLLAVAAIISAILWFTGVPGPAVTSAAGNTAGAPEARTPA
ncbi:MAG: hypothetical protein M3Z75_31465, partial [Actinomycetota bacterium]|nr:hypothetical protein [Actinomycetota bacterium]